MNREKYKQAARRELGKFTTEKLEILFSESLAELKRRELNKALDFVESVVRK